jgi:hypothetical protein
MQGPKVAAARRRRQGFALTPFALSPCGGEQPEDKEEGVYFRPCPHLLLERHARADELLDLALVPFEQAK